RVGMLAAARGDVVEAARWYRAAAEAGSLGGAFNLGLLLAREGSVPEAALWWTRAADAGHGRAALRLALLTMTKDSLEPAPPFTRTLISTLANLSRPTTRRGS
ncbi:hypothetical protein OFY01_25160, partial [Streptomyces sp. GXMU-J5]|nr:hypothetical protein [Streptomyces beihaiensis]